MIKVLLASSVLGSAVSPVSIAISSIAQTVPNLTIEPLDPLNDSEKTLNVSVIPEIQAKFYSNNIVLMDIENLEKKLGQLLLQNINLQAEKRFYLEIKEKIIIKLTSLTKNDYKVESGSSSPKTYKLKKESDPTNPMHTFMPLVSLEDKIKVILEDDAESLQKLSDLKICQSI